MASWRNCFNQIYSYRFISFMAVLATLTQSPLQRLMTSWRNCFDWIYLYQFISFLAVLATPTPSPQGGLDDILEELLWLNLFLSIHFVPGCSRFSHLVTFAALDDILEELLQPNLFLSIHFVPVCSRDSHSGTFEKCTLVIFNRYNSSILFWYIWYFGLLLDFWQLICPLKSSIYLFSYIILSLFSTFSLIIIGENILCFFLLNQL
jgi:hypothetical protein